MSDPEFDSGGKSSDSKNSESKDEESSSWSRCRSGCFCTQDMDLCLSSTRKTTWILQQEMLVLT